MGQPTVMARLVNRLVNTKRLLLGAGLKLTPLLLLRARKKVMASPSPPVFRSPFLLILLLLLLLLGLCALSLDTLAGARARALARALALALALQRRQRRGVPPQPLRQVVRLGRELQVPRPLLHPRLVPAGDAPGADGAAPAGRVHVQFPRAQEEEGVK